MAFADFEQCCHERGLRDVSALEAVGKQTVSWVIDTWHAQPTWAKTSLEYAGAELAAAAQQLGLAQATGVLSALAGGGLAVGVDVLAGCIQSW